MKYYLALDSGGTKTAAALYGGDLERIRVCTGGSLRGNTTSAELVEKHVSEITAALGVQGLTIEEIGGTCEGVLIERLRSVCEVRRTAMSGELDLGLSAAGIFGDGLLALCGTGATLFGRVGGRSFGTGGYGAAVADEGSGYWVGREAFLAAIRDREDRGPHTALTDAIAKHLGFPGKETLPRAIFSIYGRHDRSPAASVASCAPLVVETAEHGDEVAANILREAGRLLGEQMRYLIASNGVPDSVPLTISGSMWRGNPILFEAFAGVVERDVVLPKLEPVLGVLAKHRYLSAGTFTGADADKLAAEYPEFAYDVTKKKTFIKS